jgi:hypothetical protein
MPQLTKIQLQEKAKRKHNNSVAMFRISTPAGTKPKVFVSAPAMVYQPVPLRDNYLDGFKSVVSKMFAWNRRGVKTDEQLRHQVKESNK